MVELELAETSMSTGYFQNSRYQQVTRGCFPGNETLSGTCTDTSLENLDLYDSDAHPDTVGLVVKFKSDTCLCHADGCNK